MKNFIITAAIAVLFVCAPGCRTSNPQASATGTGSKIADSVSGSTNGMLAAGPKSDTVRIANDSLEYEVIIIDPGFNTWLYGRAQPRGYYGEPYLQNKNRMWVTEWNIRARNPLQYGDLYQMPIDYDPRIKYGYEVNYLLFNYLVYFQHTNNQRLGGVVPLR